MSNEQWTLILCICIFFLSLGVLGGFLWYRRYLHRIADEIAQHRAQTTVEHANLRGSVEDRGERTVKALEEQSRHIQWMQADKIAEELGAKREEAKKKASPPKDA